jgi:hypothetical protein
MKLYTEKEVVNATTKVFLEAITFEDVNEVVRNLTPIELPSDEEIQNMGKDVIVYNDTKRGWFVEGLRFMRDKIQGGNK